MKNIYLYSTNCISPLGMDVQSNWEAVQQGKSGIVKIPQLGYYKDFYASKIEDLKIEEEFKNMESQSSFSRLEKMIILTLYPLIKKHNISSKTALIISTTKGNIDLLQNETVSDVDMNLLSQKIADYFGFTTKPIIVCNACVSGVLALSTAKRLIQMNQFSDAFVVAADELSEFIISGFNSFQAMSAKPCKPYDKDRDGISLGEAVAAIYVTTEKPKGNFFRILGESSIADANHISGPSRTGEGLYLSIKNALKEANLKADEIDFISAHGTATVYNDEMESIAFGRMGIADKPLHSLKGYFGHTLGASGLLEIVLVMESLKNNWLIASRNFEQMGVSRPLNIIEKPIQMDLKYVLKTASGFGGSNSAIIIEKGNYGE